MSLKIYRQGDVLLKQVKKLTKRDGSNVVTTDEFVVAEGEQSGHLHRLSSPGMRVFANDEGRVGGVALAEPGVLVHDEHDRIEMDAGDYEIVQEQELDSRHEEAYAVAD